MMRDERTCNGQISDQLVGIGSCKPLGELGFWKFFANDWSHVEGFELVENTLELQWGMGRRMMRGLETFFFITIGDCCSVFFGIVFRSCLSLGLSVIRRRKCMRCHDVRDWKGFQVLDKYLWAVEELLSHWRWVNDGTFEGLVPI